MSHVSKYGFIVTNTPPRLPQPEDYLDEITPFADGLMDTIPQKLELLMLREDEILETREKELKNISRLVVDDDLDYWSEYFWTFFAESRMIEVEKIRKWTKYWLKLYEVASKTRVLPEVEEVEDGVSSEEIQSAKEYPIENLLGGDIRPRGNRLLACCPFHDENTPSFMIFTDDNHFHCFGCGVHGDSIDFIMKLKKTNLIEAVREINRG